MTIKKCCECGCGEKTAKETNRFIAGHQNRGENNGQWRGGKTKETGGYAKLWCPDHPRANFNGYVSEHILKAEKALGKPLPPKVQVHHANGTKDSGPLVICQDNAYHQLLHRRSRALKVCGHANWRKCSICHQYDDPVNLYVPKKGKARHTKCFNEYQRKRKEKLLGREMRRNRPAQLSR